MAAERITISKIAAEAGVSKATVSRVLNDRGGVLPETRRRIVEVINKYQFQPNIHARSISRQGCRCIGLVFTMDIDYIFGNPFYTELQRAALKAARSHGYEVLMICCEGAELREAESAVRERRVDGLLIVSPRRDQGEAIQSLMALRSPVVCLGHVREDIPCYQVCTDNYAGARLAVRHLTDLGHRRIGFINGPPVLRSSHERLKGYLDTMAELGETVTLPMVREGGNTIESGYACACAMLEAEPDLSAFFVASDLMAVGVLNALRDRGRAVPGDTSVVGFDGIPLSREFSPSLTTVDQHIAQKGETGAELLFSLIEGRPTPEGFYIDVPPTLVRRGSSGVAK